MKQKLKNYVAGKIHYEHNLTIFLGDSFPTKSYYTLIGKYIVETFGKDKLPISLSFFEKQLNETKGIFDFIISGNVNRVYNSIGIFFITATIDQAFMKAAFGKPIKHSYFGEGMEDKKGRHQFESYFVKVKDVELHIGFDHRGTTLECLKGTTEDQLLEAIKELVNLVKQFA